MLFLGLFEFLIGPFKGEGLLNDVFGKTSDTAMAMKNINTTRNSPIPHLVPLKPATQVQLYESTPSVHVPPFWHGFVAQSSISKA